jgi:hypothetical protein
MNSPEITPLHVKVYVLLGRAAFRLRYEEWKQERQIRKSRGERVAALEVEQLNTLYNLGNLTLPKRVEPL